MTSATTRALTPGAMALAMLLCISWGFNQVAIKLALPEIPALMQAAFRSLIGAAIVLCWVRLRGLKLIETDGTLLPGMLVGMLFAGEFLLIYRGLVWTSASRASLFVYAAPFFVVVGSRWLLPSDWFDRLQWLGLLLSFCGIVTAFGMPSPGATPRELLGDTMLLLAGAAWGATTLVIKATSLARTSSEKVLLYQLIISGPVLTVIAAVSGERLLAWPSPIAVASLLYQTVWVVAFTYMAWFALIQRYSASRLSAFTFLTPLLGVAAGHFVLGETLTPAFAAAAAMVLVGLILVNRPR
ncbi:MAG TPA: DMT family transporter [Xanthobacteraceae bacterium]|jgi:drug/metabolite transporter (DMT)-like permease